MTSSIRKEEWNEGTETMKKNEGESRFHKAMTNPKEILGSTSQMTPTKNATSDQHTW
jgi:hypothetical protein